MKLAYSEFQSYSPLEDCEQIRLSVCHDGREFFALLAAEPKWRERRARALELLAEAIQGGCEPGDFTNDVREQMGEAREAWVCDV